MGRNIFRDTGFKNVDLSVAKNWKLGERLAAQFRAEFFNSSTIPILLTRSVGRTVSRTTIHQPVRSVVAALRLTWQPPTRSLVPAVAVLCNWV